MSKAARIIVAALWLTAMVLPYYPAQIENCGSMCCEVLQAECTTDSAESCPIWNTGQAPRDVQVAQHVSLKKIPGTHVQTERPGNIYSVAQATPATQALTHPLLLPTPLPHLLI